MNTCENLWQRSEPTFYFILFSIVHISHTLNHSLIQSSLTYKLSDFNQSERVSSLNSCISNLHTSERRRLANRSYVHEVKIRLEL